MLVGDNGHCYSYHHGPTDWSNATAACSAVGGHIVTYSDGAESAAVVDGLLATRSGAAWIGLLAGSWVWVDNTPFLYSNWAAGEPSNSLGDRRATQLPDGSWVVQRRDHNASFVCEVSGWELHTDGNGYRVGHEHLSWYRARTRCEGAGGHLATIDSTAEAVFVEALAGPHSVWLGGSAIGDGSSFAWVNGEPIVIDRWIGGEPTFEATHTCLAQAPDGWRDYDCNNSRPYVCELDAG
jgi:hypothetical protein